MRHMSGAFHATSLHSQCLHYAFCSLGPFLFTVAMRHAAVIAADHMTIYDSDFSHMTYFDQLWAECWC